MDLHVRALLGCSALTVLALAACQTQHTLDDAWGPDTGPDGGDADVDAELDPERVECDAPEPHETGWTSETPPEIASLDRLSVGIYVAAGATGPVGARTATIWMLGMSDLATLKEHAIAGADWIVVRYDARTNDLFAAAAQGDATAFQRFEIVGDWDLETVASRELCAECRPSPAPPLAGPLVTVLAMESLDQETLWLQIVPEAPEEPVAASETLQGRRPIVVRGAYGPLLLFERDDQILVAQHHWDGTASGEPRALSGGPFAPGFSATEGEDGDILVAAVELAEPPRLALITLDGEGTRVGLREIDGVGPGGAGLTATAEESSLAAAWVGELPGDAPGQQRVLLAAASRLDLSMELGPLPVSAPMPAADRPVLAATSHHTGHTLLWTAPGASGGHTLWAAVVDCRVTR